MPNDKNGNPLMEGDEVLVRARVTEFRENIAGRVIAILDNNQHEFASEVELVQPQPGEPHEK